MSELFLAKATAILQQEVYPTLLVGSGGFVARPGFGTYQAFLERAGLSPPWKMPAHGSVARQGLSRESDSMARRIHNALERSRAMDLDPATSLDMRVFDRLTLFRVTASDASRRSEYGEWWFSKSVLDAAIEAARKHDGQILPPRLVTMRLRDELRRLLAIRIDWNRVEMLQQMTVLGRLPAVVAIGLRQPITSHAAAGTLRGGAEQVWLPWTPFGALQRTPLIG